MGVSRCSSKAWGEESLDMTRMCRYFTKHGSCRHGRQCRFAHSEGERKAKPDLRGTVLCSQLIRTGACSKKGCLFAHNADEFRGKITPQAMSAKEEGQRSQSPEATAVPSEQDESDSCSSGLWSCDAHESNVALPEAPALAQAVQDVLKALEGMPSDLLPETVREKVRVLHQLRDKAAVAPRSSASNPTGTQDVLAFAEARFQQGVEFGNVKGGQGYMHLQGDTFGRSWLLAAPCPSSGGGEESKSAGIRNGEWLAYAPVTFTAQMWAWGFENPQALAARLRAAQPEFYEE